MSDFIFLIGEGIAHAKVAKVGKGGDFNWGRDYERRTVPRHVTGVGTQIAHAKAAKDAKVRILDVKCLILPRGDEKSHAKVAKPRRGSGRRRGTQKGGGGIGFGILDV